MYYMEKKCHLAIYKVKDPQRSLLGRPSSLLGRCLTWVTLTWPPVSLGLLTHPPGPRQPGYLLASCCWVGP